MSPLSVTSRWLWRSSRRLASLTLSGSNSSVRIGPPAVCLCVSLSLCQCVCALCVVCVCVCMCDDASSRCFFGRISTAEAASLVGNERGAYLVRLSSVPGALTLTVGLGEGRAHHYRIGRTERGGFVIKFRKRYVDALTTHTSVHTQQHTQTTHRNGRACIMCKEMTLVAAARRNRRRSMSSTTCGSRFARPGHTSVLWRRCQPSRPTVLSRTR